MNRSSVKYIQQSYNEIQSQMPLSNPVDNSVIYGYFPKYPHKKSSIEKINKFLSLVLLGLVVLSLVSYYFVSDGEKTMNRLGRDIVALSNENIELQNKLDNLQSFNRVDTIFQNNNTLDTAQKVIEIPSSNTTVVPKIKIASANYNWTIGY